METWVVSVWPRSSSRKILSSWYILKMRKRRREWNELQAANDDGPIEIYERERETHVPARSTTDGLADTHQRRRWQVTFITPGPVTMPWGRERPRNVTNQSRNLEFPFGTSRTARIAHAAAAATTGSHADQDAAFAVTAVLLGERLVIIVRIVLINWSLHLRLNWPNKLTNYFHS
jgi:hypothetical protein